jgi:hypothetical protein
MRIVGWNAPLGAGSQFDSLSFPGESKDSVGPFTGRAAAAGPLLSYTFTVDKQSVTLSGRWFHESGVKNRVRGDAIFASLSFPL